MKKMTKLMALILAVAMAFSLAACTTEKPADSGDSAKAAAYDKYLKALDYDDSGLEELVVAMSPDFAPMEFVDLSRKGTDQYVGFDVLLSKYIAKELNKKLVIKPMSFDATQVAVQTANADLGISGFSWTEEREKNYFITDWYEAGDNETEQVVITTTENKEKYATAEGLAGAKVGAQGASLQKVLVEAQLPDSECILYENLNDALAALLTGKIDALAVAYGNGEAFISANKDKIDFSGFEFVVDEKYKNNVILVNQNATELGEQVNAALAKAKAEGVYQGWYEACQLLAEIKTIDELGYDDAGNKITE